MESRDIQSLREFLRAKCGLPVYGTEHHYAGLIVPDAGVHYKHPRSLACLSSSQLGSPEFTVQDWLSCLEKGNQNLP